MAKGATRKLNHSLNLSLLVLLNFLGTTLSTGVFPGSTWMGVGALNKDLAKSGSSQSWVAKKLLGFFSPSSPQPLGTLALPGSSPSRASVD